jgi:hypothetical protein
MLVVRDTNKNAQLSLRIAFTRYDHHRKAGKANSSKVFGNNKTKGTKT